MGKKKKGSRNPGKERNPGYCSPMVWIIVGRHWLGPMHTVIDEKTKFHRGHVTCLKPYRRCVAHSFTYVLWMTMLRMEILQYFDGTLKNMNTNISPLAFSSLHLYCAWIDSICHTASI